MNGQSLVKAFVPIPGGGAAVYNSGGLAYYRHVDWLGSSRLASTPSQTVYNSTAYDPYGGAYAESGTTDRSFTGQNADVTGNVAGMLYDFPAREYSIAGRWPSPDPAGGAAVNPADPQTWNRYAYVRNSPLWLVDPRGTCPGGISRNLGPEDRGTYVEWSESPGRSLEDSAEAEQWPPIKTWVFPNCYGGGGGGPEDDPFSLDDFPGWGGPGDGWGGLVNSALPCDPGIDPSCQEGCISISVPTGAGIHCPYLPVGDPYGLAIGGGLAAGAAGGLSSLIPQGVKNYFGLVKSVNLTCSPRSAHEHI